MKNRKKHEKNSGQIVDMIVDICPLFENVVTTPKNTIVDKIVDIFLATKIKIVDIGHIYIYMSIVQYYFLSVFYSIKFSHLFLLVNIYRKRYV